MTTLENIAENTYKLTFNLEADYEWLNIAQVFIESENVTDDLIRKGLINQNEIEKKVHYWQDLFFMEIVENEENISPDISEKTKNHKLYIANKKFFDQLPKVTREFGRELLIDSVIDDVNSDILIPDYVVENVVKKKSREELNKDFEKWNRDIPKEYSINYKKILSIAAILAIGLFIWQPNKLSDERLISEFAYNEVVIENISDSELTNNNKSSGLRGDEFIFKGLTLMDSQKAKRAITLINRNEMIQAKEILNTLRVEDKGNKELLFFLAISQAYSNEADKALENFDRLSHLDNFKFSQDAEFQRAMMYIKTNQRKKGKELLNLIVQKQGKYESVSKDILNKMRWF